MPLRLVLEQIEKYIRLSLFFSKKYDAGGWQFKFIVYF